MAAPVFREIATKLYAMYVQRKEATNYAAVKDSNAYFYAGYTKDIKSVFSKLKVSYQDSAFNNNWVHVYPRNATPVMDGTNVQQKAMPNVKGMGLKDALYSLENIGVKVVSKGRGKIITQSIPAGTPLTKGWTIYIELG